MPNKDILLNVRVDLTLHLPREADLFRALEAQWRMAWGGERLYIPKRPAIVKAGLLGRALASGAEPAQAIRELGFSHANGYRLLSRKWSPK